MTRSITNETAKTLALPSTTSTKTLPAPNIIPLEDGASQGFTEKVQSRSDLYKCFKDYRAKTLPFSGALPCTAFKPKQVSKTEKKKGRDLTNVCRVWT